MRRQLAGWQPVFLQRVDGIELVDDARPLFDVARGGDAKPDVENGRVRRGAFHDVHEAAVLEDDDLPVFIGIIDRLVEGAEGNVFGDEVAHVALDVVPVRKAGELAAARTHEMNVLAEILGLAQLDRKVGNDRKRA